MKKKLIALVLLFALFFSTLPQGAEAKAKQKKLDYSKMPYLDTLIIKTINTLNLSVERENI